MPVDTLVLPLCGWRIAVTRPAASGHRLARAVAELGGVPFVAPLLRVVPPVDRAPLVSATSDLSRYDWIVFTSANAVRATAPLLRRVSGRIEPRIAAIGPVTALALESHGFAVDLVPHRFDAETLAQARELEPGQRVLLPRSAIGRLTFPTALRQRGLVVDAVAAYTVAPGSGADDLHAALAIGGIDCVTLHSPSAAEALGHLVLGARFALPPIVAIGPVTAGAAAAANLAVAAVASRFDDEGILDQLTELAALRPAGAFDS